METSTREEDNRRGALKWLMGNPSRDRPWNILILVLGVALAGGSIWVFCCESHRPIYLANAFAWTLFAGRSVWILTSTRRRD